MRARLGLFAYSREPTTLKKRAFKKRQSFENTTQRIGGDFQRHITLESSVSISQRLFWKQLVVQSRQEKNYQRAIPIHWLTISIGKDSQRAIPIYWFEQSQQKKNSQRAIPIVFQRYVQEQALSQRHEYADAPRNSVKAPSFLPPYKPGNGLTVHKEPAPNLQRGVR